MITFDAAILYHNTFFFFFAIVHFLQMLEILKAILATVS